MAGLAVVTLADLKATELHGPKANAAVLAELYELYTQQMQDALGEPVASRDPLRPGYIPISEVGASEDQWDAENQMIASLEAEREFGSVREEIQRSAFELDDKADDADVDAVSEELLERLATQLGAQTCNADGVWDLGSPSDGYYPDPGEEYEDDWEDDDEQDFGCLCIDCRGRKDAEVEEEYADEDPLPDFTWDTPEEAKQLDAGDALQDKIERRQRLEEHGMRWPSRIDGKKQFRGAQWAKDDPAVLRARKLLERERSASGPDPWEAHEALLWNELRELIREMRQDAEEQAEIEENYYLDLDEVQERLDRLLSWEAVVIRPLDPHDQDVGRMLSEGWLSGLTAFEAERLIAELFPASDAA